MEYQWWHWILYGVVWFLNGWLWGHTRARKIEHKRLLELIDGMYRTRFGKGLEAPDGD